MFLSLCQEVEYKRAPNVRTANYNCIMEVGCIAKNKCTHDVCVYVNESALGCSVARVIVQLRQKMVEGGKRQTVREVDHVLPPSDAHVGTYTASSQ